AKDGIFFASKSSRNKRKRCLGVFFERQNWLKGKKLIRRQCELPVVDESLAQ
ncbi:713_t:CDS:1, partial [Racocetra persica]